VFVAASTECYRDLPLLEVLGKLSDLEYSSVVIAIHESGNQLKPSEVAQDVEKAASLCRDTHRLNLGGYNIQIEATGEEYYEQFTACCRLAKATKVASLTIPSSELGTPFNEEVERLRRLVAIATLEGALVSMKTESGRLTQDPDTAVVLCDNVKGLGVTLDPSHFVWGPHSGRSYDQLMKYVYHVQLRDTRKDTFQVRVGQGEVEYGKLVSQLRRVKYNRCLEVNLQPLPEVDQASELRKIRLLLESLL
jgi:sugar phosphate isomerase/epimerase